MPYLCDTENVSEFFSVCRLINIYLYDAHLSEIIILMVLHPIILSFHNYICRSYDFPSSQFIEFLGFNLPGVSCGDSLSLFPCHAFGPEVF